MGNGKSKIETKQDIDGARNAKFATKFLKVCEDIFDIMTSNKTKRSIIKAYKDRKLLWSHVHPISDAKRYVIREQSERFSKYLSTISVEHLNSYLDEYTLMYVIQRKAVKIIISFKDLSHDYVISQMSGSENVVIFAVRVHNGTTETYVSQPCP
jgi:hypothetical protein